jgi:hypothetical protein
VLVVGQRVPKLIDLGDDGRITSPAWVDTRPRQLPAVPGGHRENPVRRHCNSVLLPDGRVLVVGGTDVDSTFGDGPDSLGVLAVEQFDPATSCWTTLGSLHHPRNYHSSALLLPDGRVWIAGSSPGSSTGVRQPSIEIFSPPYLDPSRGPRPQITGFDSTLTYSRPAMTVEVEGPSREILEVALIRCGSTTHGFNSDQRYFGCLITERSGKKLECAPPWGPTLAPPGWYMLFVLNRRGVPSIGKFVRIGY